MSGKAGRRPDATEAVSLDTLPTPLVRAVAEWESEDVSFRKVNRLIDCVEVLCKLYSVAGLAGFVDALEGNVSLPRVG